MRDLETPQDYAEYERRVAGFMEREGIRNLSPGYIACPECHAEWGDDDRCPNGHGCRDGWNEPHFSWTRCDCCDRDLGGDREHCTGYNPTTREIQEYDNICTDCVYYAEYGRLDDSTMLRIGAK